MKKFLFILILSLFWNSTSFGMIITLTECTYSGDNFKWMPERYERFDFKIDTTKKTVVSILIYTDKEVKENKNREEFLKINKTNIKTYDLEFFDDEFVVATKKLSTGQTFKYTINLKTKTIQISELLVTEFQPRTNHKCR